MSKHAIKLFRGKFIGEDQTNEFLEFLDQDNITIKVKGIGSFFGVREVIYEKLDNPHTVRHEQAKKEIIDELDRFMIDYLNKIDVSNTSSEALDALTTYSRKIYEKLKQL